MEKFQPAETAPALPEFFAAARASVQEVLSVADAFKRRAAEHAAKRKAA